MRKEKWYEEVETPVELIVTTKCPSKWILIDKETNQIYQGNAGGFWDKLEIKNR